MALPKKNEVKEVKVEAPKLEATVTEKAVPIKAAIVENKSQKAENETSFLNRLLSFQHEGNWGRHLDTMILERIKLINSWEVAHIDNGCVVKPNAKTEIVE